MLQPKQLFFVRTLVLLDTKTQKPKFKKNCLIKKTSNNITKRFNLNPLVVQPTIQLINTIKYSFNITKPRRLKVKEDSMFSQFLFRWLENWLGSKIYLLWDKFLRNSLPFRQLFVLWVLEFRTSQYVNGSTVHNLGLWQGGPTIVLASTLTRDPELILAWVRLKISKMSLFSHRRFFRLLGTLLTSLTFGSKPALSGVHLYLVGKISVTGNAMSRAQYAK